jgi:hypothetical protein
LEYSGAMIAQWLAKCEYLLGFENRVQMAEDLSGDEQIIPENLILGKVTISSW